MTKKAAAAEVDHVDHSAALLFTLARAVESMTRIGAGKKFNAEIVSGIAAVEAANTPADGK